tara:strand:+ start:9664 stop:9906 length:243 start_codon:yes stop_codon:yes gene_type:complete
MRAEEARKMTETNIAHRKTCKDKIYRIDCHIITAIQGGAFSILTDEFCDEENKIITKHFKNEGYTVGPVDIWVRSLRIAW